MPRPPSYTGYTRDRLLDTLERRDAQVAKQLHTICFATKIMSLTQGVEEPEPCLKHDHSKDLQ